MSEAKNILPNDDELLKYVQGKSSPEDAHHIEEEMLDSSFVNDAVEGLQHFNNKKNINDFVEQLNTRLQKQTHKPKNRRDKHRLKGIGWVIVAVIVILALCFLGYFVLRLYKP